MLSALSACWISAALAAVQSPVLPKDKPVEIQISGHAGWGGRVARGEWTPVAVDLDHRGDKERSIVLAVGFAVPGANQSEANPTLAGLAARFGPLHEIEIVLPPKSRKRIPFTLLAPDQERLSVWAFALDVKHRDRTIARGELATRTLAPHRRLVGLVGPLRPDPVRLDDIETAFVLPEELPEDWRGYAALEALVWVDGKASEIRSTAQVDALKLWILGGGRFHVARSSTADLAGTSIADLLPVVLGTSRELGRLPPFPIVEDAPEGRVSVLDVRLLRGTVRHGDGAAPLVVRAPMGAGSVTFTAFDPTRAPFTSWDAAPDFWSWLLETPPSEEPPAEERRGSPRVIGAIEIAQHAGRFPDVAAPEIGGLFLLILLYLGVVGPFDYIVLRWLRRLELTWFTFPAYVALFTLFILLVGGAFVQRAANQREIGVVDHHPETGYARRRGLAAVLSPGDLVYATVDAEPVSCNFISSALYMETSGELTAVRISEAAPRRVENWLLQRGSTGLALADRAGLEPSPLSYVLGPEPGSSAILTVKNTTASTFESASLVTPSGVYHFSEIPPGESRLTGAREYESVERFSREAGVPPSSKMDGNALNQLHPSVRSEVPTEEALNPVIRKILIGLTLPYQSNGTITGLSRGLDARRWLADGGTILLAWPQRAETLIAFDPQPSKRTSVVLVRIFQRGSER